MIAPIEAVGAEAMVAQAPAIAAGVQQPQAAGSFAQILVRGAEQVDQKLIDADAAVRAFALDDSVPLHQVTFALEQARLSFELMLQVRARLVEGYQEIMRMQL